MSGLESTEIGAGHDITAPATDDAKRWSGWGTALKPAIEPAWLVRKPISESSIARNVLRWGTGAINIDGCRFAYGDAAWPGPPGDIGGLPLQFTPQDPQPPGRGHCKRPVEPRWVQGLLPAALCDLSQVPAVAVHHVQVNGPVR